MPKLQRAARAFLVRLAGENGIEEAAEILRRLADELEGLPGTIDDAEGLRNRHPPSESTKAGPRYQRIRSERPRWGRFAFWPPPRPRVGQSALGRRGVHAKSGMLKRLRPALRRKRPTAATGHEWSYVPRTMRCSAGNDFRRAAAD